MLVRTLGLRNTDDGRKAIGFWMAVDGETPARPVRVYVTYEALANIDPDQVRDLYGALTTFDKNHDRIQSSQLQIRRRRSHIWRPLRRSARDDSQNKRLLGFALLFVISSSYRRNARAIRAANARPLGDSLIIRSLRSSGFGEGNF
jgi:hypothetical protein